jgi:DUF971 family protein
MSDDQPVEAVNVVPFPSGEIGIVWSDGQESYIDAHTLRCACSCATCVDEVTGKKILIDTKVPKDIRAVEIHPVGRYAISILWSDGHDTGIYPFDRLRQLGVRP